jgi:hypothetical protein
VKRSRQPLLTTLVAAATLAGGCATVPTSDVNVPTSNSSTTTCSISLSGHLIGL